MQNPDILVLIVDDLLTMRKAVKKICKSYGFTRFLEAVDGTDALVKVRQSTPPVQFIISSWEIPKSSGLELLMRIRADSLTKSIPFLLLSEESHIHQIQLAEEQGVNACLIKPFTENGLKQSLEKIFNHLSKSKAA